MELGDEMKRRDFIKMMGGLTAATAGFAALPSTLRHALTIGANVRTGTIEDVQHVVILMQENRSFDHYFGALRGVRGFKDRFPIPTSRGRPVWHQWNGEKEVLPFRLDGSVMNAALVASMPHTFPDAQAAWEQGRLSAWPKFKTDASMGYYTRMEAPFQYALADAFTLCDAYHCSLQAATGPNRIMFWSGTNSDPDLRRNGLNSDDRSAEVINLRTSVSGSMPMPGYAYNGPPLPWRSIPELLEEAGVSWKVYQDPNDNWSGLMHGGLAFRAFRDAKPGSPYYDRGMTNYSVDDLKKDVSADTLPSVSWILPSPLKSEHPGAPSSAAQGGNFVEQVLQALTSNPEVWSKTALFLAFDENDGFFDHVPPPAVPSYDANGVLAGKSTIDVNGMYFSGGEGRYLLPEDKDYRELRPWGMGPRVPLYVISPWSRGGWVNSQVFDHTSVGMFLEKRFGIRIDAISPWHRAVSGDLTSAFDFLTPNDSERIALPNMKDYADIESRSKKLPMAVAPKTPQPLYQEPGTRKSHALPYALHVSARTAEDRLVLKFGNTGSQGAVFHVYDRRHLDRLPRRYTVTAGASLEDDYWQPTAEDEGRFELDIHGPNGFFRSFHGNLRAAKRRDLDMEVAYDEVNERLLLCVRNGSAEKLVVKVVPNAYMDGGEWQLLVESRDEQRLQWAVGQHGNWYDFTARVEGFEYRFAGRMETGQASISDPAAAG
ncbi:phosphocholine-specific phospholipase C [Dyella amyloliquefaciens]|uniref:phosphocholine-specific phospholipase C n=1 Tax=Dyella amyloliquefaciens TaxID=1770545 RepID=UPI00197AA93A|nr:phospholipase C, phosphocholine-specific [Dyella amyloliquefaciens]